MPVSSTAACDPKPKRSTYGGSYLPADVAPDLIQYYDKVPAVEMAAFCKCETTIPRSSFQRHFNASGLSVLKSQDKPIEVVRAAAAAYARVLAISKKKRTVKAAVLNRYLTEQEELVWFN